MRSILIGTVAVLASAIPAFAQMTKSPGPLNQPPTNSQASSNSTSAQDQKSPIRDQVQQNLSKAGYTDIKVMPESFLVRAKDPSGNPVMMVINPDSVAAVTYSANQSPNPGSQKSQGSGNSAQGGSIPGK